LPVEIGRNAEATDVAFGLQREALTEINAADGADDRIGPGLAAAALSDGEWADEPALCIYVPQPDARQHIQRHRSVLNGAIRGRNGRDQYVQLEVGGERDRAKCSLAVRFQTEIHEVDEEGEALVARLANEHDGRRPPIDVVEDRAEIDIDV